ncbi:MAG: WxcM-like domain-containing protein [Clostridiaceae bacterium]|nr:WxcM-like domain-containing protein [Clostridiaceae bacterium]
MPLIDFGAWRVAVLKYCDELLPENITKLQRHDESDEVFVLLQGNCTLFIADGKEKVGKVYQEPMELLKLYNIKKSTWHSHTLSKDAVVLIVENQNTGLENSPEIYLNEEEKRMIAYK